MRVYFSMRLLLATKQPNGLYKPELLENFVKPEFYNYQLTGAVGVILKLYGSIDAELLVPGTGKLGHTQAKDVRDAAEKLQDIGIHGAILADETGFGKTKQCLLVAVLHSLLYTEVGNDEICVEWPFLRPILSYEDQSLRSSFDLAQIPRIAMQEFPRTIQGVHLGVEERGYQNCGSWCESDKKDFGASTVALHKLAMANFATKPARPNAIMESIGGDTHVETLRLWRAKGMDAELIHQITCGRGERLTRTIEELLNFLVNSSPALRLVFQELLQVKVAEKIDKEQYGHHQKLIIFY